MTRRVSGMLFSLSLALLTAPLALPLRGDLVAAPARPTEVPARAQFDEKYRVWVASDEGRQTVWYAGGARKAEGAIKGNLRDGSWVFYFENGQKRAEGTFVEGRMEGPWKHYYKSGALQSEGAYLRNSKTGRWIVYFEAGGKKAEGPYVGGLKNGPWTEYYPGGQVFYKGDFVSNLAHGTWNYFFENGAFFQSGRFAEDVRVGVWKICVTPGGPCGEENLRQNEPPRVSGLPKAEDLPGETDVNSELKEPSASLDRNRIWDHD